MTVLGIDYGSNRIGTAMSDASEVLAFPHETFENTKAALEGLCNLCAEKNIRMIVLGKSQDLSGRDNPVMGAINEFKLKLEEITKLPVVFQEEFWTSQEARRFQGRESDIDASAAALILQRFLDKMRIQK